MRPASIGRPCPYPEEEIGQGAKWTVKSVESEDGMRVEKVATVELKKLDGSRADLVLTIDGNAPRQSITLGPGVPKSGSLTMLGLQTEATGIGQWDLTKLVSPSSKVQTSLRKSFLRPGQDGTSNPIDVAEDIVITMTSKYG